MITWIIGKSSEVDLVYSAYPYPQTNQPELAINTYLFEASDFKYIYSKKDQLLFKNNHNIFHNNLVIKGVATIDKEIMDQGMDTILQIDKMSKSELFGLIIKLHNIAFTKEEMNYIKSLPNLSHLTIIITLKKLELELDVWPYFINHKTDDWNKKAKQNELIPSQIINNNEILPMLNYLILTNHCKKALLIFLRAYIKSGEQIWTLHKFWESLL